MSVTSTGKERVRHRGRDQGRAEGGEEDDQQNGPGRASEAEDILHTKHAKAGGLKEGSV